MFNFPLHNQVLKVLKSVKPELFEQCHIYFGGGTLLTLLYGEYRLSRDIDFLCTYGENFSRLRRALYDEGIHAIFNLPLQEIQLPHELKTDRDGVRTSIVISDAILKFEIVAEGRIALDPPSYPTWSSLPCLSLVDQVAEKLLANGDRWADGSVDSRDLIDLAILKLKTEFPQRAIDKAEAAYPCVAPLKRAIANFQAQPDYRMRCYDRLGIQRPSEVIDGLDQLAQQFDLPFMERTAIEQF
ncbi:MAG: nucleotidyl transferase AbiEii/AbiGii toxin family protein [Leptolyngbya sp. Prado105]|nr:nucleotidyl transferase AbiEii/AbiGii toxin family protein [Leptolyngbya sp. Prado105]